MPLWTINARNQFTVAATVSGCRPWERSLRYSVDEAKFGRSKLKNSENVLGLEVLLAGSRLGWNRLRRANEPARVIIPRALGTAWVRLASEWNGPAVTTAARSGLLAETIACTEVGSFREKH